MEFVTQDLLLWGVALFWVWFTAARLIALPRLKLLPALAPNADAAEIPRVSIIVAARNEQSRIAHTVSRLLDQTGVDAELIVVNDRSTDMTPELLRDLQSRFEQLRVLEVEELPAGWLGKPHALRVAAEQATGDWLLFTDGDVWMTREVVARAIRAAEQAGVEHLCLYPGESAPTPLGQAIHLFLRVVFGTIPAAANRNRRWAIVGVGAFNLVRATAYRSVGGHAPLRMEVVDDVKLALLLRRAGFRTRIFDAHRDLEVHWAPTLIGFFRALEKNMYASVEFNPLFALLAVTAPMILWATTLFAPLTGTLAGQAAGLALATTVLPGLLAARRTRTNPLLALLVPFLFPTVAIAIGWSTVMTISRGGIVWRGTFYPLADLRRGVVRMLGRP